MGTEATLPNGQHVPNPVAYDIDGILNPAGTVTALHAAGDHVICYCRTPCIQPDNSPPRERAVRGAQR
jgi:hypothetical protein